MNKNIAKAVKIDKQTSLIEKFNDNLCDYNKRHMWRRYEAVKDLRKKFDSQFVKQRRNTWLQKGRRLSTKCSMTSYL